MVSERKQTGFIIRGLGDAFDRNLILVQTVRSLFPPCCKFGKWHNRWRWKKNGDGDDACDWSFNVTGFVNTNKHRRQKPQDSQHIQT